LGTQFPGADANLNSNINSEKNSAKSWQKHRERWQFATITKPSQIIKL
jgi:hypothetical protein